MNATSSQRVTSHMFIDGTQQTGSSERMRAKMGSGSDSN